MATTSKTNQYSADNIETMELLYGTGYLSMGGDGEVGEIVSGIAVAGKEVLDIGCGLGGAVVALVSKHEAKHVLGIDIDDGVLAP
ncbi:MAG: SAM-dependent methyltransferase, partial [Gammaproteobacteria bacterium]|nr:SAM-dependent methyltransferase [Gammaproteobacteria bacterium]